MVRRLVRQHISTNCVGIAGSVIALRKKNRTMSSSVAISTSRRRTLTFTTQTCGGEPSWRRMGNPRHSESYANSACGTHCEFITKKASFLAGGIIRCARLKKIAGCGSMQFLRAKKTQKDAAHQA